MSFSEWIVLYLFHFSIDAAVSGCCSRNRVNPSDCSPGPGKYRSRASRLSISWSTRYFPPRAPRSPLRRWVFHPGSLSDSWLQLDLVHTEHLWHCRSSPLLTNHLSHLLMVATRSRQEILRTVTANPHRRLCLRSGVIEGDGVHVGGSHGSDRVSPEPAGTAAS
jgi:hypothetical protein